MAKRLLSDEQWVALRDDPRPQPEIARHFGVSVHYVRAVKDGTYTRKLAARPEAPKPARQSRFYRPFRDGTYLP